MPKGIKATTKTTTGRTGEKRGYTRQVGSKPPGRPPQNTATTRQGRGASGRIGKAGTIRTLPKRKQRVSGEQLMTEIRSLRDDIAVMGANRQWLTQDRFEALENMLRQSHPGQRHDIGETQHYRNVG